MRGDEDQSIAAEATMMSVPVALVSMTVLQKQSALSQQLKMLMMSLLLLPLPLRLPRRLQQLLLLFSLQ
jgi:hypothetical protein